MNPARSLARRAALVLAVGAALGAGASVAIRPASAGPQEARDAWERAKALRGAPWRDRALAYRRVIDESNRTDRLRVRALLALGDVLREADHPHGAAAVEALAAATGSSRDETRLGAVLDHARSMRKEGDAEVAARLLDEVVRLARADSPRLADQAMELRSEDAFHERDDEALAWLHTLAERDRAAPHVRVRVAGRLGERLLDRGDRDGAKRCLKTAEAVVRDAERTDDAASLQATRAWLDLPLRLRLSSP
jgi:tetratricopeptide (TPR) repeat protein